MRLLRALKKAADARELTRRLERALAKQAAEHVVKEDHTAWLRATHLRDAAMTAAAIEVDECVRELKEESAELQGARPNSGQ